MNYQEPMPLCGTCLWIIHWNWGQLVRHDRMSMMNKPCGMTLMATLKLRNCKMMFTSSNARTWTIVLRNIISGKDWSLFLKTMTWWILSRCGRRKSKMFYFQNCLNIPVCCNSCKMLASIADACNLLVTRHCKGQWTHRQRQWRKWYYLVSVSIKTGFSAGHNW